MGLRRRVVVTGVPRSGKSRLARELDPDAFGTDEFWHLGMQKSDQSQAIREALDDGGPVMEGVMVVYGLRRWLRDNPTGAPVEKVVWLDTPLERYSPGQERMAEQLRKAWGDVREELKSRGVEVEEHTAFPEPEGE